MATPDQQRAELERFLDDLRVLVREVAQSVLRESGVDRELARVAQEQGTLRNEVRAVHADTAQRLTAVHERVEAGRVEILRGQQAMQQQQSALAQQAQQGSGAEAGKIADQQQRLFEHLQAQLDRATAEQQKALEALVERNAKETRERIDRDFKRQRRITHVWMVLAFLFGFVNFLFVLLLVVRIFR